MSETRQERIARRLKEIGAVMPYGFSKLADISMFGNHPDYYVVVHDMAPDIDDMELAEDDDQYARDNLYPLEPFRRVMRFTSIIDIERYAYMRSKAAAARATDCGEWWKRPAGDPLGDPFWGIKEDRRIDREFREAFLYPFWTFGVCDA